MQRPHAYSSRRQPFQVVWHVRHGAAADDAPLPTGRTRDRTIAIRRVFLDDLGGHGTIDDVGDRCDALGLLGAFSTHRSAYESIMVALRPIATSRCWEGQARPQVSPLSAPGEGRVRLG